MYRETRIFQAELIRILLFGRGSGNGELYYPFVPKANDNYVNCVSAPICDYEGTSLVCVCMCLAYAVLCLFGMDIDWELG